MLGEEGRWLKKVRWEKIRSKRKIKEAKLQAAIESQEKKRNTGRKKKKQRSRKQKGTPFGESRS